MEPVLAILGLYGIILIILSFGFARLSDGGNQVKTTTQHKFSIIIAARDEVHQIPQLLNDLSKLDYPLDRWEVIVIDDHSTDGTFESVDLSRYPFTLRKEKLISGAGKKMAITQGVSIALGPIIVTTDADCRIPPNWLTRVNEKFQDEQTTMVVGGVRIADNGSFFSKLQSLEFVSVAGVGAASLGLGLPTLCNGANLAYKRDSFISVDGFADNLNVLSGDDQYLMSSIHSRWPGSIVYLNSPDAVITTIAAPNLAAFVRQRLRWAGKWRLGMSWPNRVAAAFIWLVHLALIALPILVFTGYISLKVCLLAFIARFFVESLFLMPVANFFNVRWRWQVFVALQLLYSPYVIYVAIMSLTSRPEWKGRKA